MANSETKNEQGNMGNEEVIQVERSFNTSSSVIWKALTDADEMRKWYFDLTAFKPEKGFQFSFTGQGREGANYVHLCEVTEVIPERKLSYSWTYEGLKGYSEVSFELIPGNGSTMVRITHKGISSFSENGPDFAIQSFAGGWDHILNISLKDHIEKTKP